MQVLKIRRRFFAARVPVKTLLLPAPLFPQIEKDLHGDLKKDKKLIAIYIILLYYKYFWPLYFDVLEASFCFFLILNCGFL